MLEGISSLTSADPTAAAIERGFIRHVAERLNGRILRYSQRLELLKAGERLRISRFRANLIIAMVQHQSGGMPSKIEQEPRLRSNRRQQVGTIVAGIVLAEAATLAGVWWMWLS